MNFFCHALPYLDQPLFAACTGVPDFLSVIDRKIRARGRMVAPHLDSADETMRQVAGGIQAHLDDDHWFHGGEAFAQMNLEFAVELRDRMPGDAGFRPSFLGHILIEMLLDAIHVEDNAAAVQEYYENFAKLPLTEIGRCINTITGKPTDRIPATMRRFAETRFLLDYPADDTLMFRLNQVMRRVKLPELPAAVQAWLPSARSQVRQSYERLLPKPVYAIESQEGKQ